MRLGLRASAVLLLALSAIAPRAGAASPQPAAKAAPQADGDSAAYKDAVAELAKAVEAADYAASLDSLSSSLPPLDSLALLDLGLSTASPLARAPAALRLPLFVKAGDLCLLLGLFGGAASRYEEAAALAPAAQGASGDGQLLLRAARCYLAAGDSDKSSEISAGLASTTQDPALAESARLVQAWTSLLKGDSAGASSLAATVLGDKGGEPSARRREAGFVLWLCAEGDAAGPERKTRAAALAADYPGSPEALIASGAVAPPPLPHWYLGGLSGARPAAAPAASSPKSADPEPKPATAKPAPAPAPTAKSAGKRLQVGYFSLEDNAQALKDELASKGFAAVIEARSPGIEARSRSGGAGKSDEKRWIVVVDGGASIQKTMQALKDAGYESYSIE
jgi:hypothetical protein